MATVESLPFRSSQTISQVPAAFVHFENEAGGFEFYARRKEDARPTLAHSTTSKGFSLHHSKIDMILGLA
jgi:hypothetical protein